MQERERMLDTIMEMQRCNILKDEQIEILELKNGTLEARWGELKKFIDMRLKDYRFEGHIVSPETQELDAVLDKIKELEVDE